jgi:N-acyl-D-aspartate/D-glutamate deacylase
MDHHVPDHHEFDLVVRHGKIFDGTGGPPFHADIAIRNGKITQIGNIAGRGAAEIDAEGHIVTPGFVDIHTHYDGQAIWSDRMDPSSSHGVTTVVMGNCGVGFAPCRPGDHELLMNVMEGVEDIPGIVMAEGLDWSWETFPEYLDALDSLPRDIDVAAQLPHSPLRVYVMGARGADRAPATPADLDRMTELTREALKAGALGVTTSRFSFHRRGDGHFIPSFDADGAELDAIAAGMKQAGSGVFQAIMNIGTGFQVDEVDILGRLSKASGRPASFTFTFGNEPGQFNDWEAILERIGTVNDAGASVKGQVFPRPVGLIIGHELTMNPFCLSPSYKELAGLPHAEKLAALRQPELRARLLAELPNDPTMPLFGMMRKFNWMFPLGEQPNYEPSPEDSIAAMAKRRGIAPLELIYDLMLESDGKALFLLAAGNFPNTSLDIIAKMMAHPDTLVGLGDGGAHYGMICDSSYPTFLMTHWTRDRAQGRIDLAQAIKSMSSDTAAAVGLLDRGILAPGYKADLNIIDYDGLCLHKPSVVQDLPGGGRRLNQTADGYVATVVNGAVIARGDKPTGALPGRLVRGAQTAPVLA